LSTTLNGKLLRLSRLSRLGDARFLVVPLDHTFTDGPIASAAGFDKLVGEITDGGADAIVVHKGRARTIAPARLRNCNLIVHLSGSTIHATDVDAKVIVGGVTEAIRLGADAVSVHVNLGSGTEASQLAEVGHIAAECDRWGIPLLAMMYPRGPRIISRSDPVLIAHAANVAADLGADLVKLPLATPAEAMIDVVAASPLPVIVAGGPPTGAGVSQLATTALAAGCRGIAAGRYVFTAPSPRAVVEELSTIIHGPTIGSVPTLEVGMVGAR